MRKSKYYVVWQGLNPGIYDNWDECKRQVDGQGNAKYKAFPTREEAVEAFRNGYGPYLRKAGFAPAPAAGGFISDSLSVDAACSGNPGDMKYRGVHTASGKEMFRVGPVKQGTNNTGEFLALVHGLAFLKQQGSNLPIYSDSANAIKWVRNRKCKTLLQRTPENARLFNLIERAETWLNDNAYNNPILKWKTDEWGEIPADFGRK
jgi:ribonuclease HI